MTRASMAAIAFAIGAQMASASRLAAQDTAAVIIADALRSAIAATFIPVDRGELVVTRPALGRLYDSSDTRPLWTTDGRPTPQAQQVLALIRAIANRGLDASDYDADALSSWMRSLALRDPVDVGERARFDVALSVAVMRLIGHVHAGLVDPVQLGLHLPRVHSRTDLAALALDVARARDVEATLAALEPPYPGYRVLASLLARYRVLAADTSLIAPRARGGAGAVRPGDLYDDAPVLRRLLAALGDLAPETSAGEVRVDPRIYDSALVAAVHSFQDRHGLVVDGILGPATLAALRVPLARRVEQIELTMERWRWLSDAPPSRHIIVNVAAFRLDAFAADVVRDDAALSMKIIAGEARRSHETPVFFGTMNEVVFRPYWDVPLSIARKELVPVIRRNPAYLERERMEIVRGGDDDAVLHPPTPENLDRVAAGTLRLRQRPGPGNALGLIKFVFPNPYNVFLHGTPATELFERARRDFSHGCIRIENPPALAELVLRTEPGWDRPAIDTAMHDTVTRRIRLGDPVGVIVFYATASVDEDGRARFVADVYGHDARLAAALGR